jgi:hypothetical protein
MTSYRTWNAATYPYDLAECKHCLVMHVDCDVPGVTCKDPAHQELRDVCTEQGLGEFYKAHQQDWSAYQDPDRTPLTDAWLMANKDKLVAIRELFRDHYANNPAPPEQMELAFEPVATPEV